VSLAGKDAQIFVTGGSQSMSNEDCDPIGSGSPVLQWQIGDSDLNIWDPSATFSVEVSTDGGSTWSTVETTSDTSYTTDALTDDTYDYRVGAINDDGLETESTTVQLTVSSAPEPPTNLSYSVS